ncbi:MAG: hypothetical protein IMZ61_03415 [Planctomycetes bacterium]|nr:hypothetical protein [Planctomycetota bacterium]
MLVAAYYGAKFVTGFIAYQIEKSSGKTQELGGRRVMGIVLMIIFAFFIWIGVQIIYGAFPSLK